MSPTAGLAVTRQGIRRFLLEAQDLLGDHHYRPAAVAVLARLGQKGPLPARAFTSEQRVHGWWDIKGPRTKVTSHTLNLLSYVERVMVSRREGLERHFDLPERVVPLEWLRRAREIDPQEADQALLMTYMRAHRIFDLGDWAFGWRRTPGVQRRPIVEKLIRAGTVVPLRIDGVRRLYFLLAEDEGRLRRHERDASRTRQITDAPVRFLAPLDNLLWRRERVRDFFDFDYIWEVYVPPAKRAYGYYTMPILAGDRFVGRFDPRLDRERGRLVINLLHLERGVRATAQLRTALEDALQAFARFHGASDLRIVRSRPARLLS